MNMIAIHIINLPSLVIRSFHDPIIIIWYESSSGGLFGCENLKFIRSFANDYYLSKSLALLFRSKLQVANTMANALFTLLNYNSNRKQI